MVYVISYLIMHFYWTFYLIWFYFIMLFVYFCIILYGAELLAAHTATQKCRGSLRLPVVSLAASCYEAVCSRVLTFV